MHSARTAEVLLNLWQESGCLVWQSADLPLRCAAVAWATGRQSTDSLERLGWVVLVEIILVCEQMVTLAAEHHEETDRLKDYIQGGY